jgi:hypothetical protein
MRISFSSRETTAGILLGISSSALGYLHPFRKKRIKRLSAAS